MNSNQRLLDFFSSILASQVRDDYREAAEIAMILLGSCKQFVMYPSAGDSNARWVTKFLYGAKKYMYKSQLKLDPQTITNLKDFLGFMVYVYLPGWYMASFLSESTASDLQLAKDLDWYKNVNQSVAERVLLKLQNHSWYLGPELAWTLLFLGQVSKSGETTTRCQNSWNGE